MDTLQKTQEKLEFGHCLRQPGEMGVGPGLGQLQVSQGEGGDPWQLLELKFKAGARSGRK